MPSKAPKTVDLLVTCEHATNAVPAKYRRLFADNPSVLDSHRGYDPGALGVARAMAKQLGAPLFEGEVSRLLVELNRSLHHRALFSDAAKRLPEADHRAILNCYYHPFRAAVHQAIAGSIDAGRRVLHLSVHSFTPVLDGEVRRVECGLLYDPARRRERELCAAWKPGILAAYPAWRVRFNNPYRGNADGHTTALRRAFAGDVYLGIEIELNQALLGDTSAQRAIGRALAGALRVVV